MQAARQHRHRNLLRVGRGQHELDAASNTGIDNMREILDNARYAPTAGRYKVYLIDEVHMLSKAAFNSMLKTLEEPPEHVKFVLATTDPQKIPVTVLSRCLQFNLKPLTQAQIAARIAFILGEEGVASDPAAIALVARAAHGSLRDGLSLLDQAIAFGGGRVAEAIVRSMLGVVDREHVYRIADALAAGDGSALLAECDALAARGLSLPTALDELGSLWHRVAVVQVVPPAAAGYDDRERVATYAKQFTPELVQLCYQIATQGRQDLGLAPDEPTGFAMTLLRMLAFLPTTDDASAGTATDSAVTATGPARRTAAAVQPLRPASSDVQPSTAPAAIVGSAMAAATLPAPAVAVATPSAPPRDTVPLPLDPAAWPAFVAELKLTGMAAQLAAQSELKTIKGNVITLALPVAHKHLADRMVADKFKAALERATGGKLLLAFEVGAAVEQSLAATEKRERTEAREKGEAAFRDEPFVRELLSRFDGQVKADSITPLARDPESPDGARQA
ncbi:MAG: DNA polymerase III subunit gamma/tau [Casimicrobiaceae bacterium]